MVTHARILAQHRVLGIRRARVKNGLHIAVEDNSIAPRRTPRLHVLMGSFKFLTKWITIQIEIH